VQLSDFMWEEIALPTTASKPRGLPRFSREACTAPQVSEMIRILDERGYQGTTASRSSNDEHRQLPLAMVGRAGAPIGDLDLEPRLETQPSRAGVPR